MTTPEPRRQHLWRSTQPSGDELRTHAGLRDECCDRATAPQTDPAWLRAARRAQMLSWFSLAWLTGEGLLGLSAGVAANSISLIGWALGSVIEASPRSSSSGVSPGELSPKSARATNCCPFFFLLSPYLTLQSLRDLLGGHAVTTSALGLVVTAASLVVMPALGRAKQRLGAQSNSGATSGEGLQNLMCDAQAGAVLIGLATTTTLGWSWLDPAIGLLLAGWAIYEGIEAWQGEDCC